MVDMAKRIFIVNSVKGGCGKSTVSLHLARYLTEKGHKPVIIDLDLCGSTWSRTYGHALKQNGEQLIKNEKEDYESDSFVFIQNMLYNADKYLKRNYFFKMSILSGLQKEDIKKAIADLKTEIESAHTEIEKGNIGNSLFNLSNKLDPIKVKAETLRDDLAGIKTDTYTSKVNLITDIDTAFGNLKGSLSRLKAVSLNDGDIDSETRKKYFFNEIESVIKEIDNVLSEVKKLFTPITLNLVLCDSQNLRSLSGDDLELLESLVFKIVKQCWVYDYYLIKNKTAKPEEYKGFTDIIFDLPPGYEKHAEQIIRHLIMDLKSNYYRYEVKKDNKLEVETYLCMVSNVDAASILANVDFVEHIKVDRLDSTDPTKIKKGFFVFNDINHKLSGDGKTESKTESKEKLKNVEEFANSHCSDKLIPLVDGGLVFGISPYFKENINYKKWEMFEITEDICKGFDDVFDSLKLVVDEKGSGS